VVGITFLLRLRGPCPCWKKAVTTISTVHCLRSLTLALARAARHYGPHNVIMRSIDGRPSFRSTSRYSQLMSLQEDRAAVPTEQHE
jgi:hypothetical protein